MAEPVTALGHGTMLVPAQAVLKMFQLKKYRTFEGSWRYIYCRGEQEAEWKVNIKGFLAKRGNICLGKL